MQLKNYGTGLKSGPNINVTDDHFYGQNTILDADIIFMNMQSVYYSMAEYLSNKGTISSQNKDKIENGFKLRANEFKEYFNIGRTLIITSPINHNFIYKLENNTQENNLDIWDCIGIKAPQCSENRGRNIQSIDKEFAQSFLLENDGLFYYNTRIDKSQGLPLFYIKDTKYVVAEYYKVGNGLIIILPEFGYIERPDIPYFINSITGISEDLTKSLIDSVPTFPEMTDKYSTIEELIEQAKLLDLYNQRKYIDEQIVKQQKIVDEFKFLKLLFTADGDLLEDACKRIFLQMGFEVIKPDENRDDLIIKANEKVAVVEVKGISKSAAEKHAAQLQKWVADYHSKNGINPKGILIANTYKNKTIEDRTDSDFPDQMMKYVEQMEHSVITGLQLLALYIDFKSNKIKKEDVTNILFKTIGEISYTDKIEDYLQAQE